MPKVLIIFYSRGGNTEKMAKAIAEGAESEAVEVEVMRVDYATAYDFVTADAVAFGSPNYFGYMAGNMKDFFDRMWWSLRDRVSGKPSAAFSSAGGGRDTALLSIERIMNSFKLNKVADGVVARGEPGSEEIDACKRLGVALAKATKKEELKD